MARALRPAAALALSLLGGCNVIAFRQMLLEAALEDAGMEPVEISLGPDRVAFHIGGGGPPVLLLHGFGPPALWQWHEQVPALSRRHLVVMPDLLWFGGSWSRRREFGNDHQVRAMVGLLDRLGIARAAVVGISYGGLVAYDLAARHPERVARLVIVDSPGSVYTPADLAELRARLGGRAVTETFVPPDGDALAALTKLAYAGAPCMPARVRSQAQEAFYSQHRREKVAMLHALFARLGEPGAIADPSLPTLLVWGRQDRVFPLSIGRRLAARLPAAELAIIEDAGHVPNLEQPERFNAIVLPFLWGGE